MNRYGFSNCPCCLHNDVVQPHYELAVVRVMCGSCSMSTPFQSTLEKAKEIWEKISKALRDG